MTLICGCTYRDVGHTNGQRRFTCPRHGFTYVVTAVRPPVEHHARRLTT